MPDGVSEPDEPHRADRQPRRTIGPKADFEIIVIGGAEGEILAQQQANVFLEIARWQAARHDTTTCNQ